MDQMNGHDPALHMMRMMQQFEGFVQNALTQGIQMLGREYSGAAIFAHNTDRQRDLIMAPVNLPLPTLIAAVQARMLAMGMQPQAANDANQPQQAAGVPDLHLALINVVSAIRKAMPFITGPGAETARKLLLDAIKADGVSETARQVVAGFLSAVPGMTDQHPGDVDKLLSQAIDGSGEVTLVFYSNTELGRPQ